MNVGWVGRLFEAISRLRPSESAQDLEHVGGELVRLEKRRSQRRVISR